jgi:hypothetical protein
MRCTDSGRHCCRHIPNGGHYMERVCKIDNARSYSDCMRDATGKVRVLLGWTRVYRGCTLGSGCSAWDMGKMLFLC